MPCCVLTYHHWYVQFFQANTGDWHTDQTTGILCHEINRIGRYFFCRHDKVAFIFTILIINKDYNPAEWNIYPFHFSDGDNWDADNASCVNLLADSILPQVNLFCYGEVNNARRQSDYADSLDKLPSGKERLVKTTIKDKDEIYNAVKAFLGKGR